MILSGAIDELLFRQRLERASSAERPAGSTLALVLNWRHCALGGPVHRGCQFFATVHVLTEEWRGTGHLLLWLPAQTSHLPVLILSEITELILAKLEALAPGVHFRNICHGGIVVGLGLLLGQFSVVEAVVLDL